MDDKTLAAIVHLKRVGIIPPNFDHQTMRLRRVPKIRGKSIKVTEATPEGPSSLQ